MSYGTDYLDIPELNPIWVGKDSKMSKNTKQAEATPAKTYNKTRGEHYKDIVIAVLVAGIVAFIGGAIFANNHNAQISRAVQAVTPTAEAVPASASK